MDKEGLFKSMITSSSSNTLKTLGCSLPLKALENSCVNKRIGRNLIDFSASLILSSIKDFKTSKLLLSSISLPDICFINCLYLLDACILIT